MAGRPYCRLNAVIDQQTLDRPATRHTAVKRFVEWDYGRRTTYAPNVYPAFNVTSTALHAESDCTTSVEGRSLVSRDAAKGTCRGDSRSDIAFANTIRYFNAIIL